MTGILPPSSRSINLLEIHFTQPEEFVLILIREKNQGSLGGLGVKIHRIIVLLFVRFIILFLLVNYSNRCHEEGNMACMRP